MIKLLAVVVAAVLVLVIGMTVIGAALAQDDEGAGCAVWFEGLDDEAELLQVTDIYSITPHQEEMARIVLGVSNISSLPPEGAEILLAVALAKTELRNLPPDDDSGDGLFGLTVVGHPDLNRLDPAMATTAMVETLEALDGWEAMNSAQIAASLGVDEDLLAGWATTAETLTARWWLSPRNPTECAFSSVVGPDGLPTGTVGPDEVVSVQGIEVHYSIAGQVQALLDAAAADGISLAGWGWRDSADQIRLRRAHCGTSSYAIYEMPSSQCRPPTARPGRSMHERGLAIDFTYNGGSISTRSNIGYRWLAANAARFGLYNLPSEPWHWSTNGN